MKNATIWGAASLFVLWAGCGIDATVFTGSGDVTEDDGGTTTGSGVGGSSAIVGSGGQGTTSGGGIMTSSVGVTTSTSVTSSTTSGTGGTPNPGFTLDCGGNTACPGGGENACCWDNFSVNDPPQGECVDGPPESDMCLTQIGGFETRIECQRTSDCGPGLLCCANRIQTQQGSYYEELTCESSCNFPDIQICEDEMDSMNCPQLPLQGPGNNTVQGECQQSDLLPNGYFVCGYPN